jgi:hypothetical protein
MKPRLEGQGVNCAKLELFLGDKEVVRGEGRYDQIFLGLGGNAVATKQLPAGWNKEYNSPYFISLSVLTNKECIFH